MSVWPQRLPGLYSLALLTCFTLGYLVGQKNHFIDLAHGHYQGCPGSVIHEEELEWGLRGARLQVDRKAHDRGSLVGMTSLLPTYETFSGITGASILGQRAG